MRRMPFNADELENVNVIIGTFDFETEKLEHVSQDENYKKIINQIKKSLYNSVSYPIFIVDNAFGTTFTGILNGLNIDIYSLGPNTIYNVTMLYNPNADTLDITLTEEVLISEDNVKTIFGQDIVGSGNIDLFVHHLVINANCYFTIYSSNNLEVNTPEKLTTLLKDKNVYYFGYLQTQYIYIAAISFNDATNLWQIRVSGEETSSEITNINDTVEPI